MFVKSCKTHCIFPCSLFQGDTLAELWLNFLLLESEQELGPDGKPLPPSDKTKNPDPKSDPLAASKGGSRTGSFTVTGSDALSGLSLGLPLNPKAAPGGIPGQGGTGPSSPAKPASRSYSFTSGYQSLGMNKEGTSGTSRSDSTDNKSTSSSRSNSEIINPPGK